MIILYIIQLNTRCDSPEIQTLALGVKPISRKFQFYPCEFLLNIGANIFQHFEMASYVMKWLQRDNKNMLSRINF